MHQASAVALFCEDIRQEKSDQDIIIGIFPDNLVLRPPPGTPPNAQQLFPRMGLYLRVHLDAKCDIPKEISAKLINTDGTTIAGTTWSNSVVEKSFADAKEKDLPLVGLIFKAVISPFPISLGGGKLVAMVVIDGLEQIAGVLNVIAPAVSGPPS
jgi:hypothetical protein